MTSTSKNRAQRRTSARTPKSVLQRIHMEKAQEKGFQEGKKYAIRMMCAALALSLKEHHNLSRDQIMFVYQDAVKRMFEANCTNEILEQAEKECGIEAHKFDFCDEDMEDELL